MDTQKSDDIQMVPDDEAGNGADPQAKLAKAKEELKRVEAERREYLDGWQRAKADLANYKRDEGKRFEEFAKFANADLIADIVQALDSFDLALGHEMQIGRASW